MGILVARVAVVELIITLMVMMYTTILVIACSSSFNINMMGRISASNMI